MLIPTSSYGTSGQGAFRTYVGVEEPNYPGVFAIGFDMYPHASQNDVSAHWNGAEYVNFTIPRSTLEMVSGQFHRCEIQLEYGDGGAYVTVLLQPNINSGGGTPLTPINRWFIPGMTPYDCRVEFAGRTGGLDMSVDLDNILVQFGHPAGLVPREEFDLSRFLPLLQTGNNVLAIHGLNMAADSPDFLIEPELVARAITLQTTAQLFFEQPTPGAANGTGVAEVAPAPVISVPSGVYTSNLTVSLTSSLPGSVIRYTLNGDQPTEDSPAYTSPITIANSALLTARVYAPDHLVSPPVQRSYTLLDPSIVSFSSGLPIIVIDTFGRSINQNLDPRVTCNFTVIDTEPGSGRATLLSRPDFQGRAGLEGRGQTSWGFPKKPYNVEIRDEYDQDLDVSLLGMPADSDWILFNPYNDKTFLNDFLSYELFEKMGHYQVRRRFCEVFLNGTRPDLSADPSQKVGNSGDYVGIFVLLERIKIGNDRVDIQGPQTGDLGDPITGGYIWKKDKASPGDVVFTTPSQTSTDPGAESLKYHDPKPEDMTPAQRAWLTNHLIAFETVLYGPNWRDPVNGYAKWIDMHSWVDHHWIVEFTKQIDGYRLSDFMHIPRGGRLHFGPIWDWNLSIGNADYLDGGHYAGFYYPLISAMQHMYLRRLVGDGTAGSGDPDFRQQTIDRWGELRVGVFHTNNVIARINELTNYLHEAQARDFARWPRLGVELWPNPNPPTDGNWDVDFTKPTTYAGIIEQMKKWIIGRYAWIDSLYLKAPTLSRYSGSPTAPLSIFAPTGTVYYTTDGSDPRLAGGLVSPNAQAYTGPVTLPANARIFARAWHTNAWSPPTRADFGFPTPTLAVTEIMYNPQKPAGSLYDGEAFEFIELANTGAFAIDLTGLRFAEGIEFTFPGGPLQQVGTDTTNAFEGTGTPYTASTLGAGPGASVQAGGPSGSFLRMLTSGTGVNRNRIAFDQSATGAYDVVTAEFDFRATNLTTPPVTGPATAQDFDGTGTPYSLRSYDADTSTPALQGPDSGSAGRFIRLTRQTGNESGGLFFDATAGTIYSNVTISFDFRMTAAGTPADGIGFAFLNVANWGTSGSNVTAWSEEPNVAGSIGIGLDNYLNTQSTLEPNANHVSVHWNGAQVAGGAATPSFNMVAGQFHRVQIIIRFQSNRALVTVKMTPNVNGASGPTETLFSDFVINGVAAYRGRPAFCARTGGAWADQDIDNVRVEYALSEPAASGGLSLVLLPTATFGASGPGSGTNDYLDLPAAANVFALNFDMNIVESVNDVNLYWNGTQRGNATLPSTTLNLDNGAFHRARLQLTRTEEGSLATMTLAPDVYGAGGSAITVFSNLLISGLAPGDARVEFAGRSGGQNLGLDLDNVSVHYEKYLPNSLAAGERILLVKNRAAFESRYGTGRPIAGEYGGQLDNGGERLLLVARYGVPILDFSYGDGWYPLTDGLGFSLVLANPSAPLNQWSDAATWRASTQTGGSPGLADPAPPAFVPVVINEVISNPDTNTLPGLMDAIELRNLSSTQSVTVSGWYLTDEFDTPKKFRIPTPTVIPPNGYVVFYETNFNAPGSGSSGFGLRAEGEEVYLFSANGAGELTGYYHGFDFGASEANVSFGRYVDSEGDDQFVAQAARTLGAENSGPKVGPVVISEVMYHPPDLPGGEDNQLLEFVELHNVSGSAVLLGPDSTNVWRLRDAVDYHFPEGTSLPAGGYLLVVSFDPAWDVSAASLFRAAYGLAPTVPLYGPYTGKLDNSDDRVELTKPGTPDADTGEAPNILVDKVRYHDHAPWPQAADGAGYSLHRINVAQFGNDPINWVAEPPTPGGVRVPGTPPTIVTQPVDQTVFASQTVTLSVVPGGAGPFRYQWRFNGNNLPGETNASLVLANVQTAQGGAYQVVVLNASGAVDSAVATVTVVQAATILAQPAPRYVNPGATTNFTVVAIGNGPLSYQWRFNGGNLPNETNATLVLTNVQLPNDGDYDCLVTDAIATISTVPARLVVLIRPVLTQHPAPTNQVLAAGATLNLTANATGTEPLMCRWRRQGSSNIVVNGGLTLTLSNLALLEAGYYDIVVTNLAGGTTPSAVSSRAYVTVVEPPSDKGVLSGGNATFRAVLRSAGPSTNRFWWLHNGTTVVGTGTNIAPSTAAVSFTNDLALTNINPAQAGQYTFLVSNTVVVSSMLVPAVRGFDSTLVVDDTVPPTLTCPDSFAVNAAPGQCAANPSYPPPVATDNIGVVGLACAPAGPYPVGANVVTCWAWDLTGNSNSCAFTITVNDTQNPTLSGCPAPVTLTAGPSGQVAVPNLLTGVTANDNCGMPILTQAPAAGTMVGGGTNVVTLTARDASGNEASCQTAVIVEVPVTEVRLTIELDGTNVVIRWPQTPTSWRLEETAALTSPPAWGTSSASPVLVNGQWQAVVPWTESTNKFFRLQSP
jgi:hypothetical protein